MTLAIAARAAVSMKPLREFKEVLEADLRRSGNGPIRAALREWRAIYREFINERFQLFASGGGNWPVLAESTVRRKARLGLDPRILVATRLMEANLDPRAQAKPAQLNQDVEFGVRVDFGSDDVYDDGKTVREVVRLHQDGGPRLPRRRIVVSPDAATYAKMRAAMRAAVKEVTAQANGGAA